MMNSVAAQIFLRGPEVGLSWDGPSAETARVASRGSDRDVLEEDSRGHSRSLGLFGCIVSFVTTLGLESNAGISAVHPH